MDYFHRAQAKYIGVGGYRCPCCAPLSKRKRRRSKTKLKKAARQVAKREVKSEIADE